MSGKYSTYGASYQVQFNDNRNLMYLSVFNGDELEGTLEYIKILEYNLTSNSIREIITFKEYVNSWFFSSANNKLYFYNTAAKTLLSKNLLNSKTDTILNSGSPLLNLDYIISYDSLNIITLNQNNEVKRITISLENGDISNKKLLNLRSFPNYRNGYLVQTFKDLKTRSEEVRLFHESNMKSAPIDFKNFNTYWVSENNFIVIQENKLLKMDKNLSIQATLVRNKIHVIDVVDDKIFVSFYSGENEKLGILDTDFSNIIEINNIDINSIVRIK